MASKMRAFCRVDLVAEKVQVDPAAAPADSQGRWKLNAGSEMVVTVEGLNPNKKGESQPIRLVIDLAACKPKNPKIHALADHDHAKVMGFWDAFVCGSEGIFADLHLVQPTSTIEAELIPEAVRTAAFIRTGVPIQVSVGADAGENGSWELAAGKVMVNGREYDGDGDMPLYILRCGELFESSIVTFGADDKTGRLAAKQNNPPVKQEANMSDKLKALLGKFPEKHHGLVARCVAEDHDESTITNNVHAADMAEVTAELTATKEKLATVEAELATVKAEKQPEAEEVVVEETTVTAKQGTVGAKRTVKFGSSDGADDVKKVTATKVVTMSQAMKVTAEKHPELKGFALRKAARAAFPTAEEK